MESIDELKRDLQEHLSATSGVTGSGTVACRLWNAINNVLFALKKGQVAKDIAELEAENKKLSAFITMEHTDPPYDYGDSQDVQFAIRIAELEAQLAAAQERERWIPVTDIRPKRGQHVRVMATMEYDGEDHWIAEDGTVLEPGNILEWRELPAAPKEDK